MAFQSRNCSEAKWPLHQLHLHFNNYVEYVLLSRQFYFTEYFG